MKYKKGQVVACVIGQGMISACVITKAHGDMIRMYDLDYRKTVDIDPKSINGIFKMENLIQYKLLSRLIIFLKRENEATDYYNLL